MPTVIETLHSRSSKRAYLAKPVEKEILEKILDAAAMTPSGANMQPWKVLAISNPEVLKNIGDAIIARMGEGFEHDQDIQYYPVNWVNPYKKRRIMTGSGLYKLMEIDRKDDAARLKMWHDNFKWFGAQTVFFIFTDKANIDGAQGALIDCGAYMQSLMLAAQDFGVASCPQGSTTEFGKVVSKVLEMPEKYALLYSVVLGYEDTSSKINSYQPKRASIEDTVTFID